ncbi:TnsA endonuclease N-terminal domain-containing protein [Caenispirillum bisanense]|uniref:TnsA endonuclease N-terminal domain-containing protein n=1 Tax=Caenispirillum bisanense TaxID=414052 RepID=UPI0031D8F1C9
MRGTLVDQASGRELVFESRLERGLAEILLARRDVSHIADQPPAVHYMTPDGRTRGHTFDFLVTTVDGKRLAIAVKPEAKVKSSGIQTTLSLVRAQIGSRFADAYLLRTDRHITRDRVFNAQLLLRGRVCRIEADVAAMRAIVETLPGSFRLADLVARAGIGARGFNAVVSLIDDGLLQPGEGGKIDYLTYLRRAAAK